MARVDQLSATSSTVTVQLAGLDTNYQADRTCQWHLYENGSWNVKSGIISIAPNVSTAATFTFAYLSASTTYSVKCVVTLANGNTVTISGSITTTKNTVTPWSWSSSNGPSYAATAEQTKAAYTAITTNGYLGEFSYLVWNDMVDKLYEIISDRSDSKGWVTTDSDGEYYGTLAETKMTSTDDVITAKRFNAMRWNCGQYVTTGLSKQSAGDVIYGSLFIALANAMNSCIRS